MLRDREYVYAVYQERSFSRAAQRLFISQPALSSKVKKVEERVGAPLFDRSTNPIRLTPAGKCYVEAVEQVMGIESTGVPGMGSPSMGRASCFCRVSWPGALSQPSFENFSVM